MAKNPSVYIETTVISYLTSGPSPVIKIAADQQTTREWWAKVLPKVDPVISEFVIFEISRGDVAQASARREVSKTFESLERTPQVDMLAKAYLKKLSIPERSHLDAFHLAIASVYNVDFLISWNCKHIANAFMARPIAKINKEMGFQTPIICTPRELMEV